MSGSESFANPYYGIMLSLLAIFLQSSLDNL